MDPPNTAVIPIGSQVTITCTDTSPPSQDLVEYYIYKSTRGFKEVAWHSLSNQYKINAAAIANTGIYTCEIKKNFVGDKSSPSDGISINVGGECCQDV